ncbi:MAG: hypothetical protein M3422_17950 [Actinomycetota bacterium]|nr:hypothetical protein [Actinomycetota bacterium]
MAKGQKRRKGETFESEVRRQFEPVADRLGLAEEEITSRMTGVSTVRYVRDGLTYSWNCDTWEGHMWVHIVLDLDDARYTARLSHLVTGTQTKGDQPLLDNCRSWLVLQRAVESHTVWVERLHPHLIAPDAPDFILASGGKKATSAMPDASRQRPCPEATSHSHGERDL